MRPRIVFGRWLVRVGNFVKSLALVMMKSRDLIELGRRSYLKENSVSNFNSPELMSEGLRQYEMKFFNRISSKKSGRMLVLGAGGGREALHFARKGYSVTAMDFVKAMVDNAVENAEQAGLKIEGIVQELTALDLPEHSYDIVWLSSGMYSSVPTRKMRISMLKRIRKILKTDGVFSCQFHWGPVEKVPFARKWLMKIFAVFFLGNFSYQTGDMLWGNKEFIHLFSSEKDLREEFTDGGFRVGTVDISMGEIIGGALLYP